MGYWRYEFENFSSKYTYLENVVYFSLLTISTTSEKKCHLDPNGQVRQTIGKKSEIALKFYATFMLLFEK